MAVYIDVELTAEQQRTLAAIPATSWFTQIVYRNAASPPHPNQALMENNEMKQAMVNDWVTSLVKGKRVLDLFSANGGFSVIAAQAGAKEVVGGEFSKERVECSQFVADTLKPLSDCPIRFVQGNVYDLATTFREPFDVVLCLGGLYHIADPAYVLSQIGRLTSERMILQTTQVLPLPGNWAKFVVRRQDRTDKGLTSIRGGYGTWHYSPGTLCELILHGGFTVVEGRRPPLAKLRRFPWYLANCEKL